MKKAGPVLVVLVGMFMAAYGRDMIRDWLGEDLSSAEVLSREAEKINKECPKRVDEETELIKVEGREATIIYTYRLTNMAVPDIRSEDVRAIRPKIRQRICGDADTRRVLKAGTSMHYVIYDRNDKHITTLEITPSDCGF